MMTDDKQVKLSENLDTNKQTIKKINEVTQNNKNLNTELYKKVEQREQTYTALANLMHQRQSEDELESERIKNQTANLVRLVKYNNDKQDFLKNILIKNDDKNSVLTQSVLTTDMKQAYMKNILLNMMKTNKEIDDKLNNNVDRVSKLNK